MAPRRRLSRFRTGRRRLVRRRSSFRLVRFRPRRFRRRRRSRIGNNRVEKIKTTVPFTLVADPNFPNTYIAHMSFNFNGNPTSDSAKNYAMCTATGTADPIALLPTGMNGQFGDRRLSYIKIKYFPTSPPGSVEATYTPIYTVWDRDGMSQFTADTWPSMFQALQYVNGVKTFNMYRPFTIRIRMPWAPRNVPTPQIVTGSEEPRITSNFNIAGRWMTNVDNDTSLLPNNVPNSQHFKIMAHSPFPEQETSATLGIFVITAYFVYKDRETG